MQNLKKFQPTTNREKMRQLNYKEVVQ